MTLAIPINKTYLRRVELDRTAFISFFFSFFLIYSFLFFYFPRWSFMHIERSAKKGKNSNKRRGSPPDRQRDTGGNT